MKVLLGTAFCVTTVLFGQVPVPDQVARINKIDYPNPGAPLAEIINTGDKSITAVAVRNYEPPQNRGCTWIVISGGPGVEPGKGVSLGLPPTSNLSNTRIVAVTFSDGTVMGGAIDEIHHKNVLDEIHEFQTGYSEEWSHWASVVSSLSSAEPRKAVEDFLASVRSMTASRTPESHYHEYIPQDDGRNLARDEIQNHAKNVQTTLEAKVQDERWILDNMLGTWIGAKRDFAASATRRVN